MDDQIIQLLAGVDTLYFSCDLGLSAAMCATLAKEKATAQALGKQRQRARANFHATDGPAFRLVQNFCESA